jgi:hypothetical protein
MQLLLPESMSGVLVHFPVGCCPKLFRTAPSCCRLYQLSWRSGDLVAAVAFGLKDAPESRATLP